MQGKGDRNIVMVENVSTIYEGERKPAIKDVNLNIGFNELVFLVGPNASGKTTLLETINGLQPISKGRVLVFGLDVRYCGKTIRQEIGYVPQDFMVGPLEPYTAIDVVMMGRYSKIGILRKPEKEDFEKTIEAMRLVGIDDLAKRPIGKLSGGQQQKVMISRALAKEPKLLLLDEPFSNLDPYSRRGILELIGHLHDEHEMTIIVVTHDLQQIPKRCQRVVVMNGGRIIADESSEKALAILEEYTSLHKAEVIQ